MAIAMWANVGRPKGKGKGKGSTRQPMGSGSSGEVGQAIREMKDQLMAQGGTGLVWIENWRERFPSLGGQPRDFMESRPDKFKVIPGAGKSFTVALAGPQGVRGGKGVADVQDSREVGQAIREIKEQLQMQGGSGIVWIESWQQRFPSIGSPTPRAFMESRPDKFKVVPQGGKSFFVSLAGSQAAGAGKNAKPLPAFGNTQEANRAVRSAPAQSKGTLKRTPITPKNEPPAKKTKTSAGIVASKSLEEQATQEAIKQLKNPSNTEGKVLINGWKGKYQDTLGPLREFLEGSDRFIVHAGEGLCYTVELIDRD